MNLIVQTTIVCIVVLVLQRDCFAWGFDIGGEHIAMTWAAVQVLGSATLAWLGTQAVKLYKVYCGYPDFNWARYGTLTGEESPWSDSIVGKRVPDKRRDWNASRYCLYDEAAKSGEFVGHGPPASVSMARKLLGIAMEELKAGRFVEGVRYVGAAIHYAQDSASIPHAAGVKGPGPLHGLMESVKQKDLIRIDGYQPRPLGANEEDALAAFDRQLHDLVASSASRAPALRSLSEAGRADDMDPLVAEQACELARFTADVITTLGALAPEHCRASVPDPKRGSNLVANGSFEQSSVGDGHPDAWVRDWCDLNDTEAALEYLRDRGRSGSSCVSVAQAPAAGAEWRTRWADAVPVAPGQRFRASGWLMTRAATGPSSLRVYLSDEQMELLEVCTSAEVVDAPDWLELTVELTVPAKAIEARLGCYSAANGGQALFDDVELVRL